MKQKNLPLFFLTPYEKSVIELMKDKNNHRLLIDHWFSLKIKNGNCSFDFYLLSQQTQCQFLFELSDVDFVYLLQKLNKYVVIDRRLIDKNENNKYLMCFLVNGFHREYFKSCLFTRAITILFNDNIFQSERKLLWIFAMLHYQENFLSLNFLDKEILNLRKWLHILKRDAFCFKEIFDAYLHNYQFHCNFNFNYYYLKLFFNFFFESYLNNNGTKYFNKMKKRVISFFIDIGYDKRDAILKFRNFFELYFNSLKLNETPYLKTTKDFDDIMNLSGSKHLNFKNMSSGDYLKNLYLTKSPRTFSTQIELNRFPKLFYDFEIENVPLDFMGKYAEIHLQINEHLFPNIQDDDEKQNYLNRLKIALRFDYYKSFFLSFHYFCYKKPNGIFNQNNPYCLDENTFKKYLIDSFIIHKNYKNGKAFRNTYTLFFDDIDQICESLINERESHQFAQYEVIELLVIYLLNKDKGFVQSKLNSKEMEQFYNLFFIERYSSQVEKDKYMTIVTDFLKSKKGYFNVNFHVDLIYKLFDDENFRKMFKNWFNKYLKNNNKINILSLLFKCNNDYVDNDLLFSYIESLIDLNDKRIEKMLLEEINMQFKAANDYSFYNEHKLFYLSLCAFIDKNAKRKTKHNFDFLNQDEKDLINKLKNPIKLDSDFYCLKQEIPQIEYWIS